MPSIDDILNNIRTNQGDLYGHILFVTRIIKQYGIKSVFTNYASEGFLCNYVKNNAEKISFNCVDEKHYGEYGNFDNIKFINKPLEKVNIQKYDLIHLNCNHKFDDWSVYLKRILKDSPKFIVLSNTKLNQNQTESIINCIYKNKYEIIKLFNDYNGCVVFKFVK
jgi:hypothetical protein